VAGGIVSDSPEVRKALLREAVRRASTIDNGKVALKQYKVRIDGELTTDDHYYNRELDISIGRKEVWNNLDPRNREMIEATRNASPALEYPSEDVGSYFRLLLTHLRDHGIPCPSRSWIEDLLRFRMYKLAVLRQDGKIAAATLVKEFRDTVSFPFTCHAPRSEKQVYRLYWELILNYQEAGFRIVHSGRIPNNDDTDAYRLGWGGKKHAYFYQYHPGTSATEYSKKRGIKRQLVEKCWKNLPVSVAGAIGPMIVRRFP
jgi:hypothetical protein